MKRLPRAANLLSAAALLVICAGGVRAAGLDEPVPGALVDGPQPLALSSTFRAAEFVPGDVTLFLSVDGAAAARAELAGRPIARWLNESLAGGEAGKVWGQLARRAEMEAEELFDALLGQRFAIAVRKEAAGGPEPTRSEWAVLSRVDPRSRKAEEALRALRPIAHGPKSRMAMLELPEHELLIARRGHLMLIGPKDNAGLFREVLGLVGRRGAAPTLADVVRTSGISDRAPIMGEEDKQLQMTSGLYVRHEKPLGGYSIAFAHLAPENLTIRHVGEFDASPFTRAISDIRIDPGILDAFEEQAMIALLEPTDIGRSMFETFLIATIGEGLLSQKMRSNLGDRRIIIIGEVDGHQEREPIDAQLPTGAVCLEIKGAPVADKDQSFETRKGPLVEDFDRKMLDLVRRINHLDGGSSGQSSLPDVAALRLDEPRAAQIQTGGLMPHASALVPRTLNWSIVEGPQGAFYVIATHPSELQGAVRALQTKREFMGGADEAKATDCSRGPIHSCGVMNGPRIAHHLLALRDSEISLRITGDDEEQRQEFRAAITLLSDLALGMERVRWRLARPGEARVDLEVRIRLAPPESAETSR